MGGMMEMEQVRLCGNKAVTIKKASMHDYGMDFYYNYFEDDRKKFDKQAGNGSKKENDDKLNFFDFARRLKMAVKQFHKENRMGRP